MKVKERVKEIKSERRKEKEPVDQVHNAQKLPISKWSRNAGLVPQKDK